MTGRVSRGKSHGGESDEGRKGSEAHEPKGEVGGTGGRALGKTAAQSSALEILTPLLLSFVARNA